MEQVKRVSDQKNNGVLLSGSYSDANSFSFEVESEDREHVLSALPALDRPAADEPVPGFSRSGGGG